MRSRGGWIVFLADPHCGTDLRLPAPMDVLDVVGPGRGPDEDGYPRVVEHEFRRYVELHMTAVISTAARSATYAELGIRDTGQHLSPLSAN